MKNTLTIIGALAVAAAVIAAVAIFVKKYTVKFSIEKNCNTCGCEDEDNADLYDDINWEEVPVEEDEEEIDFLSDDLDELSKLDTDAEICKLYAVAHCHRIFIFRIKLFKKAKKLLTNGAKYIIIPLYRQKMRTESEVLC